MNEKDNIKTLNDETVPDVAIGHFLSFDQTEPIDNQKKKLPQSLRSSKRMSYQQTPRPKSSKSSKSSINIKNCKQNIESLNRETSQQVIKSIYHLISSKFPTSTVKEELSEKDQEEIQEFFLKKKLEFNLFLEKISENNEKPQKKIKNHQMKELNILESKLKDEIKLLKKKQSITKRELIKKASEKMLKEQKEKKKQKELEKNKKKIEERKVQEYEKNLIIQNIEGFYRDRIGIIKDSIQKELENKKILCYDEKRYAYSLSQQEKQYKMQMFCKLRSKYELKIEDLKEKFRLINTLSYNNKGNI